MTFMTMDESWPTFGSSGFSQVEWVYVVSLSIKFNLNYYVHVLPRSLCVLYVLWLVKLLFN